MCNKTSNGKANKNNKTNNNNSKKSKKQSQSNKNDASTITTTTTNETSSTNQKKQILSPQTNHKNNNGGGSLKRSILVCLAAAGFGYSVLIMAYFGSISYCHTPQQQNSPSVASCDAVLDPDEQGKGNLLSRLKKRKKERRDTKRVNNDNDDVVLAVDGNEKDMSNPNESLTICDNSALVLFTESVRPVIPAVLLKDESSPSLALDGQCSSTANGGISNNYKKKKKRRNPLNLIASLFKKKSKKNQKQSVSTTAPSKKTVFTFPVVDNATPQQTQLIQELATRTRQLAQQTYSNSESEFNQRVASVPWGGPTTSTIDNKGVNTHWWTPIGTSNDGSSPLFNHLMIMKWPTDLITKFPYGYCSIQHPTNDGMCNAEEGLLHTLEWREKYQPWLVTPSLLDPNSSISNGWLYHRGFSHDGASMIWYRPGMIKPTNDNAESYLRVLMHALDYSVMDSLLEQKLGRYNVVIDCSNFGLGNIPNIASVKRTFTMMQDHFPGRVGVIFMANLAGPAQLFLKMIKPLLTDAVKQKMQVVPNDKSERNELLHQYVHPQHIPHWLDGEDQYNYDVNEYYSKEFLVSEQEGREYLTTMPYHA